MTTTLAHLKANLPILILGNTPHVLTKVQAHSLETSRCASFPPMEAHSVNSAITQRLRFQHRHTKRHTHWTQCHITAHRPNGDWHIPAISPSNHIMAELNLGLVRRVDGQQLPRKALNRKVTGHKYVLTRIDRHRRKRGAVVL